MRDCMNDFSIQDPLSWFHPMGHFTEMIIPGSRGQSQPLLQGSNIKIVPDIRSSIVVPKEISLTSRKSSSYVG